MTADARQLDAFVAPSRVGGLLEVARDETLERLGRGEPVAWVAPGKAGTVVYAWVAYHDGGYWVVAGIGLAAKAHPWPQAEVARAVAGALSMLDPDSAIVQRALEGMRAATERHRAFLGPQRVVGGPLTVTIPDTCQDP